MRNDGCNGGECGAPWNEIDIIGDDGEEETVCGCYRCVKRRKSEDMADYMVERDIERREARRDEKREWAGTDVYNWNER